MIDFLFAVERTAKRNSSVPPRAGHYLGLGSISKWLVSMNAAQLDIQPFRSAAFLLPARSAESRKLLDLSALRGSAVKVKTWEIM